MTDPPRVLFVSSHAQRGGAESYVLRLIAGLGDRIRPSAVALEDGPMCADLGAAGVECAVVPTGRRIGIAAGARGLRRVVRRERPDVVHANGVKAAAVAGLALLGRPEPVVWVKHDHSWDGPWGRLVARMVDLVVGVSESAVRSLRPGPSVRVVPQGVEVEPVDRSAARLALRDELGIPADAPVLICVGRLDPAKGFDDAVSVLSDVVRPHPDACLVVAGGTDPKHPEAAAAIDARAAALGIAARVHRLGWRADVQALIAAADVLLVTSRAIDHRGTGHEGFGLVAAEAVMHGVPVAGFASGATPEVVGDAGLLVPAGDVAALAAAVERILADGDLRSELAAAAAARATSYDVPRWLDAMAGIYAELAARPRGTV